MKLRNNYENAHQKSLIKWARLHPEIGNRLIHIPNEGKRDAIYGRHLKEMGIVPGCFDLFLAIPRYSFIQIDDSLEFDYSKSYGGFWIEMKSINGKFSASQEKFFESLDGEYRAGVFYHWVDAAKAICDYLGKDYGGL
jgi:hypothetical protein